MLAKCRNEDCPLKKKCYRYLADKERGQIWGEYEYEPDGGCEYFIDVRRVDEV